MTSPQPIAEAHVHDGVDGKKLVRVGDSVDILPVELMEKDPEHGDYFNNDHYDFLREWLGEGPYPIHGIGRWPCGRVMVYLKTSNGRPGVYASDLMTVDI